MQRQYDIDLPSILVGSGAGCGVLLNDPSIAERHAKLLVESGVLLVEDLGSESARAVHQIHISAPEAAQEVYKPPRQVLIEQQPTGTAVHGAPAQLQTRGTQGRSVFVSSGKSARISS